MTPGASHLTEKWAVPPWTIAILRKFNIDPAHSIFNHVINISIMRFIALRCWNLKPCLNCTENVLQQPRGVRVPSNSCYYRQCYYASGIFFYQALHFSIFCGSCYCGIIIWLSAHARNQLSNHEGIAANF